MWPVAAEFVTINQQNDLSTQFLPYYQKFPITWLPTIANTEYTPLTNIPGLTHGRPPAAARGYKAQRRRPGRAQCVRGGRGGDMTGMVEIPVQRLEQEEQELLRAQEVERQRARR